MGREEKKKKRTSQGSVDSEDEGFEGEDGTLDLGEEEVGGEGNWRERKKTGVSEGRQHDASRLIDRNEVSSWRGSTHRVKQLSEPAYRS